MTLGMYTGNQNNTDAGLIFFILLDCERGINFCLTEATAVLRMCHLN